MYDQEWRHTRRLIGFGIFALVAALVIGTLAFLVAMAWRGTSFGSMPFFGFGWIGFLLVFFLFFGLMRWAFWWPGRWGYYRGYGYGRENEAYHSLRERYARGEITKDQYDQMMRDLYQAQAPPPP